MITSERQKWLLIVGIVLSVFMASMEATVVATAMPTIASQLGGLELFSWVFIAYQLTSTTLVPVFGKMSDLYGRRRVYLIAMILFLGGSLLCGMATTMNQLILYRAIQGIGAGGVLPLSFIMIGEMFTLEERARFQGIFSSVWGISAVVGPLIGGFIVDNVSWHWVFYINVLPGLLAIGLIWTNWRDMPRAAGRVRIDFLGAILLTTSVVALMLGLQWGTTMTRIGLVSLAAVLLALLVWWERQVDEPILPLPLFRDRLFSAANGNGLLGGVAMFGMLSFVPLFVQGVRGTAATQAGLALAPQMICWVLASIVASNLILRFDYKRVAMVGMLLLMVGTGLMAFFSAEASLPVIMVFLALMGLGMGLSVAPFMVAVQSTVERRQLGSATSTLQFSRSIGGTIGTGIMGAALSTLLFMGLAALGEEVDPSVVNSLIAGGEGAAAIAGGEAIRAALASALEAVFAIAFVAAVLAFAVTLLAPGGKIADLVKRHAERMTPPTVAAEALAAESPEAMLGGVEIH